MITNVDYLVQQYAVARGKMNNSVNETTRVYWRGAVDMCHTMLYSAFSVDDFNKPHTLGYYVIEKDMEYDAAVNEWHRYLNTIVN